MELRGAKNGQIKAEKGRYNQRGADTSREGQIKAERGR